MPNIGYSQWKHIFQIMTFRVVVKSIIGFCRWLYIQPDMSRIKKSIYLLKSYLGQRYCIQMCLNFKRVGVFFAFRSMASHIYGLAAHLYHHLHKLCLDVIKSLCVKLVTQWSSHIKWGSIFNLLEYHIASEKILYINYAIFWVG